MNASINFSPSIASSTESFSKKITSHNQDNINIDAEECLSANPPSREDESSASSEVCIWELRREEDRAYRGYD
ncbi:hypothetical protein BABINDRAFT_160924 [Babjeviella inositovora NRRL Y-12698]|uniref:Uncharacterized protein n=1 Tax=Babjeviella inositovora NRRL Y-12698 TaxID=984486 RepID=A0A1E3QSL5_9ASCO|nr:uncharacterized protein BABINDRAFT_160924 [Babjeviella inositovora NRRL Y-12698]ODQ80689.1 hypothetical protein BABINDRAFT_160924 [Babjeviella inositovora NRRL Y-12698]